MNYQQLIDLNLCLLTNLAVMLVQEYMSIDIYDTVLQSIVHISKHSISNKKYILQKG